MSEVSHTESARHATTSVSRRDAAAASKTATEGQARGNDLPRDALQQRERSSQQSAERTAQVRESVDRAVESLNDYAQSFQRDLEFSVDEELGRPIVHVVDRSTQEVIRQIPTDVAIRLARNLQSQQPVALQGPADQGRLDGYSVSGATQLGLVNTRV